MPSTACAEQSLLQLGQCHIVHRPDVVVRRTSGTDCEIGSEFRILDHPQLELVVRGFQAHSGQRSPISRLLAIRYRSVPSRAHHTASWDSSDLVDEPQASQTSSQPSGKPSAPTFIIRYNFTGDSTQHQLTNLISKHTSERYLKQKDRSVGLVGCQFLPRADPKLTDFGLASLEQRQRSRCRQALLGGLEPLLCLDLLADEPQLVTEQEFKRRLRRVRGHGLPQLREMRGERGRVRAVWLLRVERARGPRRVELQTGADRGDRVGVAAGRECRLSLEEVRRRGFRVGRGRALELLARPAVFAICERRSPSFKSRAVSFTGSGSGRSTLIAMGLANGSSRNAGSFWGTATRSSSGTTCPGAGTIGPAAGTLFLGRITRKSPGFAPRGRPSSIGRGSSSNARAGFESSPFWIPPARIIGGGTMMIGEALASPSPIPVRHPIPAGEIRVPSRMGSAS